MDLSLHTKAEPSRCPWCHAGLAREPIAGCAGCGTPAHAACMAEGGGCAVLGCPAQAGREVVVVRVPAAVGWEGFVADADPWLALGAALADAGAWDGAAPIDDLPAEGRSSASGSRAA